MMPKKGTGSHTPVDARNSQPPTVDYSCRFPFLRKLQETLSHTVQSHRTLYSEESARKTFSPTKHLNFEYFIKS